MNTKGGLTGRILGAIVFIAGIAMLIWTFQLAFRFYNAPVPSAKADVAVLSTILADMIKKVVMLLVMLLAGSLIAGKGVHLFIAAHTGTAEAAATPKK